MTSVRAENDSQLAESSSVIRVGDNDGDGGRDAALIIGEDVTISAPATYGVSVFGSKTTETVTVFGTIEAVPAAAIAGNGSAGYEGTTIIIKDGAVLESGSDEINENPAIYHPQAGELIIEGEMCIRDRRYTCSSGSCIRYRYYSDSRNFWNRIRRSSWNR